MFAKSPSESHFMIWDRLQISLLILGEFKQINFYCLQIPQKTYG